MSSRLCSSCNLAFTGSRLLKLERGHHQSRESIIGSADRGCYICGIITRSEAWRGLDANGHFESTWYLEALSGGLNGWFNLTIDAIGMDRNSSDSDSSEGSETGLMAQGLAGSMGSDEQEDGEIVQPTMVPGPIWVFAIQPSRGIEPFPEKYTPPKEFFHPTILDLGYRWYTKCRAEHSTCNSQNATFCPTRLLEIISQSYGRVVSTREETSDHPYATLSHCWGKANTLKLTTSSIEQLQSGISVDQLPASYQEAIQVCNRFGFRYIWIDSLCIIQDSPEDWHREAMAMKDVYRNSLMNIAAAAASDNTKSSFAARDASTISPLPVITQWEGHDSEKYYLTNGNSYRDEVGDSPLRRRAWVVQEVWLSSRNLYLTKNQLWWKCCEREASEAYPGGLPEEWSSLASHTGYGKQRYDSKGLHHTWNRLVETYSACSLTVPSDKTVAFAGIAQHFQSLLSSTDDYVAGLWRSQLPLALCWFSTKERRAYRPSEYRAPSWSWASIDGGIRFGHHPSDVETNNIKLLCSVEGCQVYPADQDYTGSLKGGSITLNGRLTRIGFSNDRMKVEDADGNLNRIPGADTREASFLEGHWTLVDMDEKTHRGYATCSYMEGLTAHNLATGMMNESHRKTNSLFESNHDDNLRFFALPIMSWVEFERPWMKGLILCLVEVEGIRTYQRVGRFSVRGSIPSAKLMQSPAETVLIL